MSKKEYISPGMFYHEIDLSWAILNVSSTIDNYTYQDEEDC